VNSWEANMIKSGKLRPGLLDKSVAHILIIKAKKAIATDYTNEHEFRGVTLQVFNQWLL